MSGPDGREAAIAFVFGALILANLVSINVRLGAIKEALEARGGEAGDPPGAGDC
ncbi:MAG: hypothetical protein KGM24_03505 [Elusimicrobia bacterium]|nr:hypothetical protein [Elusimicrobiota bacterium]